MSKPLTIDELKAMQVGDWVWIVKGNNHCYECKYLNDEIEFCSYRLGAAYKYSDYGKTWLAYKNKEQAEALDGYTVPELVEALNNEHNALISEYERAQGHRLKAGEFLASKNLLDKAIELLIQDVMSNTVDMEELSCNKCPKSEEVCVSGDCTQHWKDYYLKKAERRLAELKGE